MTTLQTDRLIIRPVHDSDLDTYIRWESDPLYAQYMSRLRTPEQIRNRVAKWTEANNERPQLHYAWTIEDKAGAFVGHIRFWQAKSSRGENLPGIVEIGYGIDPIFWNNGYMTEALIEVTRFAHDDLKLHRVEGAAIGENTGSWRVMEKAGFQKEAHLRYRFFAHGKYWPDFFEFASVRPELIA